MASSSSFPSLNAVTSLPASILMVFFVLFLRTPFQLFIEIPYKIACHVLPLVLVLARDFTPPPLCDFLDELIGVKEQGKSMVLHMVSSLAPHLPIVSDAYAMVQEHVGK